MGIGTRARRWRLYVDESGNLDELGGAPVVAGVLVEAAAATACAPRARAALREAAPWIPWPLHAWLLRRPVMHAVWAHAGTAGVAPPQATNAAEALEAIAHEAFAAAVARTRAGRESTASELEHLERRLRVQAPERFRPLRRLADDVRGHVLEVIEVVAQEADLRLLAASETKPGAELSDYPECPGPYLPLLEVLLQRTVDALLEVGDEHLVDVFPLTRDVQETAVGRRVHLHARHVALAAARATGADRTATGSRGSVRLNPGQPVRFDTTVNALLVLADVSANTARASLRREFDPLPRVEAELEDELGISTRLATAGGSNLAAAGLAREFVDGHRSPGPALAPLEVRPGTRRWAVEQAREWAGLFLERGGLA